MIEEMPRLHMSEAEVVKDIQAVLEKVCQDAEVVVERGYRTIAVITPVRGPGRPIGECIALAQAHGSGATLDEDFARDVEEAIRSHQEPWNPPSWD